VIPDNSDTTGANRFFRIFVTQSGSSSEDRGVSQVGLRKTGEKNGPRPSSRAIDVASPLAISDQPTMATGELPKLQPLRVGEFTGPAAQVLRRVILPSLLLPIICFSILFY